ncbi:MAG TPA: glycosyltransferase family A protein [Verrucomicrobiae bacterium]
MKVSITTTIPVRNGQAFIGQTLESLARQTRKPDRVVVLDNVSTDATTQIVQSFKGLPIEYIRHPKDIGLWGNFNRCLDFAAETDYLQILHADDALGPRFYEVMTRQLDDCRGRGLAWCLDDRIDENNRLLSVSGKPDGQVIVWDRDTFLARKAEIGNQAFCATLLKTDYQPIPERFQTDVLIYADMVFWPKFGMHCDKIVLVNEALAQYRWHGSNMTNVVAPDLTTLVSDIWKTMDIVEALREKTPGVVRRTKLTGLVSVRAGIMAKRFRQLGNTKYSRDIVKMARAHTGWPLWLAGQFLVQLRELLVYKIARRPRHRQNIFS